MPKVKNNALGRDLILLRQVYPYENVGISNMIGTPTNDVFLDK